MDLVVIAVYIGAMIGIGFYAKGRAKSESDFLVAGRAPACRATITLA